MRHFDMDDSLDATPGRWYLGEPLTQNGDELDPRDFTAGSPVDIRDKITIRLDRRGTQLDLTFAAFDMLVAKPHVADILDEFAPGDIQRIPARVERTPGKFEVINVLRTIACLDENRSDVTWWTARDGRPEKVGEYRMIINLAIDPKRAKGAHLFRLKGWEVALICSETLRTRLEDVGVTGVKFIPA